LLVSEPAKKDLPCELHPDRSQLADVITESWHMWWTNGCSTVLNTTI